ncbi:MAG TPA: metal ABC transporter ATP-binding protein [bacterium]|nr:metal ABC transporter ATP-binding protein [bacterium]
MKRLAFLVIAMAVIFGSGCAKKPEKIAAASVSPLQYKDYDCDQIAQEMDRVGRKNNELYHRIDKMAKKDAWTVGLSVGFAPFTYLLSLFGLFAIEGGDGEAEYSQLKGEYEALQHAAIQKKCNMEMLPPSPEQLIKAKDEEAKKKK